MLALKIIGGIVLFFAFILSLRAKITVEYNDEVKLWVKVLFFKIKILPKAKKKRGPHSMSEKKAKKIKQRLEKKAQKKKQKKQEKKAQKEIWAKQPKKKKSLDEILDIISMVKDLVGTVIKKFFGHLRIDLARLKINVATGDAATTAIAYGAVCDAALHLLTALESVKGIELPRSKDIDIRCDYLADGITADIKISFALRVWHVFHVAIAALITFIKHSVRMKDKKQDHKYK